MSAPVFRAHERFAACQELSLRKGDVSVGEGLLIEVSLEGCRLSGVDQANFREGDKISFWLEGFGKVEGQARWSGRQCLGLRFARPLHHAEMYRLLETLRSEPSDEPDARRRYAV